MRRMIVLLMVFFGIVTIIGGIAELQSWHVGPPVFHIVVATIFAILCLTHIVLNRKALFRYIRGTKQS